jgi:arylsulfatase A-like enzyme
MKEFDSMSQREKQLTSRAMEVYAGMVDCIDQNIGKVLEYLEANKELDSECPLSRMEDPTAPPAL